MKKNFSFWDAFTLVLFALIITGKLKISAWFIFMPWVLEGIFNIIDALGVKDRLKFVAWRIAADLRIKAAGKKARREMGMPTKATANPGSKENEDYFKK